MKLKTILFVCTGNTCRSPMAEVILKNKIKLSGLTGYKVSSAGILSNGGKKMSENSVKALKLLGYNAGRFLSRKLTQEMIDKSYCVICMTEEHKNSLMGSNILTIKEVTGLNDVIDPYGGGLSVYIATSHQIEDACNIIINKLCNKEILL